MRKIAILSASNFAMYWSSGRLHIGTGSLRPRELLPLQQECIPELTIAYIMLARPGR